MDSKKIHLFVVEKIKTNIFYIELAKLELIFDFILIVIENIFYHL